MLRNLDVIKMTLLNYLGTKLIIVHQFIIMIHRIVFLILVYRRSQLPMTNQSNMQAMKNHSTTQMMGHKSALRMKRRSSVQYNQNNNRKIRLKRIEGNLTQHRNESQEQKICISFVIELTALLELTLLMLLDTQWTIHGTQICP